MIHAAVLVSQPAQALAEAVRRLGSQGAMARLLGVAQPSVWRWLRGGKAAPAEHVLAIEAATGISRHDLRPDLYPRDATPPASDLGNLEPAR